MAAHAPVDAGKHMLYYAAGANAGARTDSLSNDGPLLARANSWWAAALGHRLVVRAGGDVEVPISIVTFVTGESWAYSAAVRQRNLTGRPNLASLGQLTADKEAAGLAWARCETQEDARLAYTAIEVDPALAALDVGQIDGHVGAPLGNFFDSLSVDLLLEGDASNSVVVQVRGLLQQVSPADRALPAFARLLQRVLTEAGPAVAALDPDEQAAEVAAWLRRTRVKPAALMWLPRAAQRNVEMARRCRPTPAERFQPLYERGWRRAFPSLSALMPHVSSGDAALEHARAFAQRLGKSGDFDDAMAAAVDLHAKGALRHLEADSDLRAASDEDRIAAAAKYTDTKDKESQSQELDKLHSQSSYKDLLSKLEALNTATKDTIKIGQLLLSHGHPAGALVMLSKRSPGEPVWKVAKEVQSAAVVRDVMNIALSIDKHGAFNSDYGIVLSSDAVAGALARGNWDPDSLDWWSLVATAVTRAYGASRVGRLRALPRPRLFWVSYGRFGLAEPYVVAATEANGWSGTGEFSAAGVIKGLVSRVEDVNNLPDDKPGEPGTAFRDKSTLAVMLYAAIKAIVRAAGNLHAGVLLMDVAVARRPAEFLVSDDSNPAYSGLRTFDRQYKKVADEVESDEVLERFAVLVSTRGAAVSSLTSSHAHSRSRLARRPPAPLRATAARWR
jgi:hypothetical protein